MRNLLVLGAMLAVASAGQAFGDDGEGTKILTFDTMIGVPRPFTGATNAIRMVPGGGLPWVVAEARGELRVDGRIKVRVRGLVLDPNDAGVPADRKNVNPSPEFRALVSCLSRDAAGAPTIVNVSTDPFPATTGLATEGGGNARIEAHVELPQPCIAPIIFVTSPTGSWFAATGM